VTAADQQRDAHHRALRWAHALTQQVDRLHADRAAALAGQEKVRAAAYYGDEDAWSFHMMEADKHFAMVAARQLLRALDAFGGDDRLPATMPQHDVRLVRDALEHWDEPTGKANTKMRARGADPGSHAWTQSGPGVLGDVIDDAVLRAWAVAVYDELVTWDPW
jgi:hypothetical protein